MDKVIEGKAFINGQFEDCCIGINNGKIVEIKKVLKGDENYKFKDRLIIPAGVDIHVHFRDPGMTHKEDFYTGSTAAAFGGISCVCDMPNTIPQTTKIKVLDDKIKNASEKSVVDFGIYSGISDNNIDDIEKLSDRSNGFKIYLGSTTNNLSFSNDNLKKALFMISKTKKPVLFHAEDDSCLKKHKKKEQGLDDHLKNRPSVCEEIAIKNIISSSQGLNLRSHICHLSSIEGLELLRNHPGGITCGATPHHLLLNVERKLKPENLFKVNPPIRTSFDRESLFNALKLGIINILESDHAPHTFDEKEQKFEDIPSGIPGVETMYPIFLYLVKKEIFPLDRLIYAMCENPANLLNIPKGRIAIGMDADLIVINLKEREFIKQENLHSKCGFSPFNGWPSVFPDIVFIRGEKVIDEKEIQVKRGFGRFIGE